MAESDSVVINHTCNMDSIIAMEEDVSPEDLQVLTCWLCLLYVVQCCSVIAELPVLVGTQ